MLVVVGGHSRKIGKTSVVAAIIRETRDLDWTAVKITQHGYAEPSMIEETDPAAAGDSARFLAAGALRSFLLRTGEGRLADVMPALQGILHSSRNAIVESNSILELIRPDLFVVVLDFSVLDFKDSTRRFAGEADAFVLLNGELAPPEWAGLVPLNAKPVFRVQPPEYVRPELIDLVRTV